MRKSLGFDWRGSFFGQKRGEKRNFPGKRVESNWHPPIQKIPAPSRLYLRWSGSSIHPSTITFSQPIHTSSFNFGLKTWGSFFFNVRICTFIRGSMNRFWLRILPQANSNLFWMAILNILIFFHKSAKSRRRRRCCATLVEIQTICPYPLQYVYLSLFYVAVHRKRQRSDFRDFHRRISLLSIPKEPSLRS